MTKPAKPGAALKKIRVAMYKATAKYLAGGRENPGRKPVTLRLPKQPAN